jgi:hypothetical protein
MAENPLDLNDDGEVGAFELSILEEELQSAKRRNGKPPAWWVHYRVDRFVGGHAGRLLFCDCLCHQ